MRVPAAWASLAKRVRLRNPQVPLTVWISRKMALSTRIVRILLETNELGVEPIKPLTGLDEEFR